MRGSARIAAALGLLLLGVIGLFPPLKRPADLPVGSNGALGSRTFLLSGEYMFYTDLGGQRAGKAGAEIDGGRLFAEALVLLSAAGIGAVALHKPGARPAEPSTAADPARGSASGS
jgi:hypothetical protein